LSRYLLSEHAQQDFLAHERHTAERFGERQADRLSDAFFAAFDRVAAHPSAGHVRDDLAPPGRPLRFMILGSVKVFKASLREPPRAQSECQPRARSRGLL